MQEFDDPDIDIIKGLIADCEQHGGDREFHITGKLSDNWERFCSLFQLIEAAGGVVLNSAQEWLFIHRLGRWDLPKGKLEKGEQPEQAAVREVSEECGIPEPELLSPIVETYHTYRLNGELILKRTYWYLMRSTEQAKLVPQTEEGITDVRWVNHYQVALLAEDSYGSIRDVLQGALPLVSRG